MYTTGRFVCDAERSCFSCLSAIEISKKVHSNRILLHSEQVC